MKKVINKQTYLRVFTLEYIRFVKSRKLTDLFVCSGQFATFHGV